MNTVKTRRGHSVQGLEYSRKSSTFPIKGSIVVKGYQPDYNIWTLDGMYHAPYPVPCKPDPSWVLVKTNGIWYKSHPLDIIFS